MSDLEGIYFGPCTRCPKVGRTDENGQRGMRDSSHYYCKRCRREYQRTRYVGPEHQERSVAFVTERLDHIIAQMQRGIDIASNPTPAEDFVSGTQSLVAEEHGVLLEPLEALDQSGFHVGYWMDLLQEVQKLREDIVSGSGTSPKEQAAKVKLRRGPANQTYEEMVRDYDLALQWNNADNAQKKRAEILRYFPERGLPKPGEEVGDPSPEEEVG